MKFLPKEVNDTENFPGQRVDGKNLRDTWIASKNGTGWKYVETKDDLNKIDASTTDYLLGLFSTTDIGYLDEQEANNDPSLVEMTEMAIKILSKNEKGFFLFVEGIIVPSFLSKMSILVKKYNLTYVLPFF